MWATFNVPRERLKGVQQTEVLQYCTSIMFTLLDLIKVGLVHSWLTGSWSR